jgi:hypothetical protein
MIVGAQKCATTSLYALLNRHPFIEGSSDKEPAFFALNDDWLSKLDYYHSLFEDNSSHVKHFEASTVYTFLPLRKIGIYEKVYSYNPNMKIIYLVRDPIHRIISSYMHAYERGWENQPIEKALILNRLYIDVSRYATQIRPWIKRFGPESVCIVDFDDLINNTSSTMEKVLHHVGVDPALYPPFDNSSSICHANKSIGGRKLRRTYTNYSKFANRFQAVSPSLLTNIVRPVWRSLAYNRARQFNAKPSLSPQMCQLIISMLDIEIDCTSCLLGKDLSHWKASH